MTYITRKTRLFLTGPPDDYEKLKNRPCVMRLFDPQADWRSWSVSSYDRHQHLMDIINYNLRNEQEQDLDENDNKEEEEFQVTSEVSGIRSKRSATNEDGFESGNERKSKSPLSQQSKKLNFEDDSASKVDPNAAERTLREIASIIGDDLVDKSSSTKSLRKTVIQVKPGKEINIHVPKACTSAISINYDRLLNRVKYLKWEYDRNSSKTQAGGLSRFKSEEEMNRHLLLVEKQLKDYQELNMILQTRLDRLRTFLTDQQCEIERLKKCCGDGRSANDMLPPGAVRVKIKQHIN